jgi:hypothetical protein
MTHLKNTALMKLLVELLAIPLSNQKTVAKWLVIAIPLGYPKTATKWLVMVFASLALSITLGGCGKSDTPPVASDATNKLCGAIQDTGLTKHCVVDNRNSTVGVVIDTNGEAARSLCVDIANKMKPLTADLTGQWKLQIFSPYRDDKPLAYCVLQ